MVTVQNCAGANHVSPGAWPRANCAAVGHVHDPRGNSQRAHPIEAIAEKLLLHGGLSVSYTHLDVYKRQVVLGTECTAGLKVEFWNATAQRAEQIRGDRADFARHLGNFNRSLAIFAVELSLIHI